MVFPFSGHPFAAFGRYIGKRLRKDRADTDRRINSKEESARVAERKKAHSKKDLLGCPGLDGEDGCSSEAHSARTDSSDDVMEKLILGNQ